MRLFEGEGQTIAAIYIAGGVLYISERVNVHSKKNHSELIDTDNIA